MQLLKMIRRMLMASLLVLDMRIIVIATECVSSVQKKEIYNSSICVLLTRKNVLRFTV